jgi:single-stranded DNA-binding protein
MNNKANNSEETKAAAPAYQNQVRLIGFIGGQPECHDTWTVFSIAVPSPWKTPGSEADEIRWHRIVIFAGLTPTIATLAEGDHVMVDGELCSCIYEEVVAVINDEETTTEQTWEIRARAVRKLVRKKKKKPASS